MTLTEWLTGFAGSSPVEWIATIAGFLCVYLLIRRSIFTFVAGLIQVTLYTWIFYHNKLYSDTILQVFYIGFQFYGWWIWSQSTDNQGHVKVEMGHWRLYSMAALVSGGGALLLGAVMANFTDASFPYTDAFITCASLVAQWLLSYKKLLNWTWWMIVDVVAIAIYWQKGLYPTSVLYSCFLVMSAIGQWQWWENVRQQRREAQ